MTARLMDDFNESRRFARRACKLRAKLTVREAWDEAFGEVRDFDVTVRNFSVRGVSFLFFRQLFPDDVVTIALGELVRSYRVARCRRISENAYEIGAELNDAADGE